MSYQLAEVKLKNTGHIATNTVPLVVDLSPITGNDASFLRVSAKVSYFNGVGAAAFQLQHSHDGGVTWENVPAQSAESIVSTGVFTVETIASTGILSPSVRVVITPDPGVSIGLMKLYKTFSPGPIIPTAGTGAATETTALDILAAVDDIEAKLDTVNATLSSLDTNVADIETIVGNIKSDTATIVLAIDGVEALLSSLDTSVNNIETEVVANLAAMKTQVDNIFTAVDGIEAVLATLATSAKQDTIISHVDGIEALLTSLVASSAGATSMAPVFWDFSAGGQNLVANTWKEIIASTSVKAQNLSWWNPTGQIIEIGFGAAAAEVAVEFIGPGDGQKRFTIPAGTRVSFRCGTAIASNTVVLGFIN